ncbi:MAG TPA: hypothetical protein VIZ17_00450 [Acetobacteraceae bacterium]
MRATDGTPAALRVIAILGAVALVVWALADVVLLVFMAALLAIILRGISGWLAARTGAVQADAGDCQPGDLGLTAGIAVFHRPATGVADSGAVQQLNQTIDHLRAVYGDTAWGHLLFQHLSPSVSSPLWYSETRQICLRL